MDPSPSRPVAPDADAADHALLDDWALVDDQAEIVEDVPPLTVNDSQAEQQHVQETDAAVSQSDEPKHKQLRAPSDCLSIRLRTGESIRSAWFKPTQAVDDFIAEFFAQDLANGKKVRLIYMGMLLIQGRYMGEYGIEENGVIHSVITDAPPTPHPEANIALPLKGLANPVNTLLLVTGFFLYGFWTLLYHFPHLFSWKSIVLLSALSLGHISAAVSRFSTA